MPKWERRNLLVLGASLLIGGYIVFQAPTPGAVTVLAFIVVIIGLLVGATGLIQMMTGEKSLSDGS